MLLEKSAQRKALCNFYSSSSIAVAMKSGRMRLAAHVAGVDKTKKKM